MSGRPCTDAPEAVANIDVTATGWLLGAAEVNGADTCGSNPSMAAESAATRAAERRVSSARDRHALMPNAAAAATDAHVRTMSTVSMCLYRSVNSTATSTTTSTGVPRSVAGEKRHCRTAWIAR
jgi:hypothetical protein